MRNLDIAGLFPREHGGLFGHGTLTATMRAAPRDQIGLALGAWGAVQATAAGVAIAAGGFARDAILALPGAAGDPALPYLPVFGFEIILLVAAIIIIVPLRRARFRQDEPAAYIR